MYYTVHCRTHPGASFLVGRFLTRRAAERCAEGLADAWIIEG